MNTKINNPKEKSVAPNDDSLVSQLVRALQSENRPIKMPEEKTLEEAFNKPESKEPPPIPPRVIPRRPKIKILTKEEKEVQMSRTLAQRLIQKYNFEQLRKIKLDLIALTPRFGHKNDLTPKEMFIAKNASIIERAINMVMDAYMQADSKAHGEFTQLQNTPKTLKKGH